MLDHRGHHEILFPLNRNGTTLTFVPHNDPSVLDTGMAIKHTYQHTKLDFVTCATSGVSCPPRIPP